MDTIEKSLNLGDINMKVRNLARLTLIPIEEFPKYDLFLSQVIEFLDDKFKDENYTMNIIQNYIKHDVVSKPVLGKKKGYTRIHLIQLFFISYMRPVLTTDEIKKVFRLAFNDINDRTDDIISFEEAYEIFYNIQRNRDIFDKTKGIFSNTKLEEIVNNLEIEDGEKDRIRTFIAVLALISEASFIKTSVKSLILDDQV
ncbi:MAG TPA: DUF1836 domain-containing protein [Clostridiaceae bacterium]|nr:DUF1836 domain-containing protein [Clostridiaceae bacterium]